jgi:methylenetetrahydrofolate dehydrogenase (NADP+)/methenyltetrahydrofolate cyclohydrolase
MGAIIMDGRAAADELRPYLVERIGEIVRRCGTPPRLVAILAGADEASAQYVRNKSRLARSLGLGSETVRIPEREATTARLIAEIERLNRDPTVNGILVQIPLPSSVVTTAIFDAIVPAKDVDGVGAATVLAIYRAEQPAFAPCTPRGVLSLLRRHGVPVAGRRAVIIGRSDITGKPLAMMLGGRRYNATVTWCHRHSPDLGAICRDADILASCAGVNLPAGKFLITADMVKPGACVIDVGFRRLPSGEFTGDVDFEGVRAVAGWITPNPGGIGPMTVMALMQNVVDAARYRLGLPPAEYPF